eukprot:TRINITY_DN6128_c0_g2_i1.p1 TRINITY_DN6128_c0_g2~~TRINITY_DN6128_c0_g2_i1.p1  ORF type:complete len:109 (-),score=10.20 TRINITY_DN6128_c0_g2_i1:72-398(-)
MSDTGLKMNLDLSKVSEVESYDSESNIYETVTIEFHLPDGKTTELKVSIGETVQNVKFILAEKLNISPDSAKLYLNDNKEPMFDPLSLNDFPVIEQNKKEKIKIRAEF